MRALALYENTKRSIYETKFSHQIETLCQLAGCVRNLKISNLTTELWRFGSGVVATTEEN